MTKKSISVLCVALALFTLAGCWDYREYENMAHISITGIDYDKESNEVTVSILELPSIKGESNGNNASEPVNKTGAVHSAVSADIYDALSKLQQVVASFPFFGYANIIVIGEEAARHKMYDIVENLDRTSNIRASTHLVIAENAQATISTKDSTRIMSPGEEIAELLELSRYTGAAYSVTLQEFEEMLAIGGLEGTLPRILTLSNEDPEVKGGEGNGIRADVDRVGDATIAGTAVFKGERFVGYLNEQESRGYGWLTGKKILRRETSDTTGGGHGSDFYSISKSKTSVSVRFVNGKPEIDVTAKVAADVRKVAGDEGGSGFILAGETTALEKTLADGVRADMEAALRKCRDEYKSDVFGFGFAVFRKNNRLWTSSLENQWDALYPTLKVNIDVRAKITNTGTNIRKLVVK